MALIPMETALKQIPKDGQNGLLLPSDRRGVLSANENAFLDALGAAKLRTCSNEMIRPVMAAYFVKIGLDVARIDKLLLQSAVEELRNQYGNLTLKELELAFNMAMRLQLDFDPRHFQSFSLLYLSQLMTAYLKWSSPTYEQLRPGQDRGSEQGKIGWSPYVYDTASENQVRQQIEIALSHVRSGVLSGPHYVGYEWYRRLTEDGYIDEYVETPRNKKASELTMQDKDNFRKMQQIVYDFLATYKERNIYVPSV